MDIEITDEECIKPNRRKKISQIQFIKIRNNKLNIIYSNEQSFHEFNGNNCRELLERSLENYKELMGKLKCDLPSNQDIFQPHQTYRINWKSELTVEKVNEIIDDNIPDESVLLEPDRLLTDKTNDYFRTESSPIDQPSNEWMEINDSEYSTKKIIQLKLPGNVLRKRKIGNSKISENKLIEIIDVENFENSYQTKTPESQPNLDTNTTQTELTTKQMKSTFLPPRHVPSLAEQLNYHPVEVPTMGSVNNRLKRFHETQKDVNSNPNNLTGNSRAKLVQQHEEEYLDPKERAKRLKKTNSAYSYRSGRSRRKKQESESSEDEEATPPDSQFVSAFHNQQGNNQKPIGRSGMGGRFVPPKSRPGAQEDNPSSKGTDNKQDEYLKAIDSKLIDMIMNEIVDHGPPVHWDDIAGLDFAKATIKEIVVWPMLRPDIFTGLRGPPKGILLFGPPGTGKTLIGKCIASQAGATFFSISASSLTSKWVGEGEKMVRALFSIAKQHQPAVIFIDEIDSLLTQRSDSEHESSRRIKTEFLVQLDGATTQSDERILVVGATNRPQEIDEAARRRLSKRLYIPLPDGVARNAITSRLMSEQSHSLNEQDLDGIVSKTAGFSGADMTNLCREAALGPIRSLDVEDIFQVSKEEVRSINYEDFINALSLVKPSVSENDLDVYIQWNDKFGSTNLPRVI